MGIIRPSLAACALGAPFALFAACGLDESGTATPDASQSDVVTADVSPDVPSDTYVGPTCATIDASCLDAEVPDGWVLFDLSEDAGTTCPGDSEDFEAHPLITNPQLRSDSCTCATCTTTGAWVCNGTVGIVGGTSLGGCTDEDASFPSGPTCVALNESSGLGCTVSRAALTITQPSPTGTATCDASFTGTELANADNALGCRPAQCTTDYCGQRSKGFQTCIVHNGDPSGVCPAGFHPAFGASALATAPGNVTVSCGACGCSVTNAAVPCTGTIRVFEDMSGTHAPCDGDGGTNGTDWVETLDAEAQCQSTGICSYTSLYYVPNGEPQPTCAGPGSTPGDASLTNALTICCAP